MKEVPLILLILRETVSRSLKIATFQHAGEDLPESKSFAIWSAILSIVLVIGEQLVSGHGMRGALLAPVAWLFAVWITSLDDEGINYRVASAMLIGTLPVCAAMILVAGYEILEWIATAWGTAVVLAVLVRHKKELSLWR